MFRLNEMKENIYIYYGMSRDMAWQENARISDGGRGVVLLDFSLTVRRQL